MPVEIALNMRQTASGDAAAEERGTYERETYVPGDEPEEAVEPAGEGQYSHSAVHSRG